MTPDSSIVRVLRDDDGIVNADRSTTRQPEATADNGNGDRHETEPTADNPDMPNIAIAERREQTSRTSRTIAT
jgi:hypothetical protein